MDGWWMVFNGRAKTLPYVIGPRWGRYALKGLNIFSVVFSVVTASPCCLMVAYTINSFRLISMHSDALRHRHQDDMVGLAIHVRHVHIFR